jgi:GDP/UDP-N,N'-diacetylbacillosamine 2-epimerase (hydrolysing)
MKIFLITSSRADFGLLKNLILEMNKLKKFNLKIIATGSHFSKKHGSTYKEIIRSKIKIFKKIIIKNRASKPFDIINDMSVILKKVGNLLLKNRPDLLIILGDRYEILSSAMPFYFYKIPIVHIHGGELTIGSLDDGIRHCLTKISNIHFVANEEYKRRVIQLGEHPKYVFNVGGLGVDSIHRIKFLSKKEIQKNLNIKFKKQSLIINFQPENSEQLTKNLLIETLNALKTQKEKTLIFTMPGSDLHKNIIFSSIKNFVKKNNNSYFFKSLGSVNFLSCLNYVDAMVGNSSSGLLEMPTFKKPTINIGNRQLGRLQSKTVVNVDPEKKLIIKAIDKIYSLKFKKILKSSKNPYGEGKSAEKIVSILKKINLKKINNKIFFDLKFYNN